MKNINNQELDLLIKQAIQRQELLNGINKSVMAEIRHSARKQKIRQWTRIVAFAFGVPALTIVSTFMAIDIADMSTPITAIPTIMSGLIFAASVISLICNFSITDV